MKRRRLLVLGQTGQLATALLDQADLAHWDTVSLSRQQADFRDPDACLAAVSAVDGLDLAINAVAHNDVDGSEHDAAPAFQVNHLTPARLARHFAEFGVPFLHVSTDFVFPGRPDGQYRETDETGPLNAYGESKLAGERDVLGASHLHAVFRTAWVYAADHRNFVTAILSRAVDTPELSVVSDQFGNPTSANDLAAALLHAGDRILTGQAPGGLYHLANRGQANRATLASEALRIASPYMAVPASVRPVGSDQWPTAARRPSNASLCCDKFEAAFDYELPDWKTPLKTVVETWCKENLTGSASP